MRNKEEWNAGITNMIVREEDVHDRAPVRQGHVSAFLFTPSAFASESFACLLRFASSPLSLSLCLSFLSVSVFVFVM